MMINGTRDITTVLRYLTIQITLTINNISINLSSPSSQFWSNQEESTTHMRWMKSREHECQIILEFQKTEIFMVNLAGFQTLMSNALKTITIGTVQTESISMVQWTTMLLLTIPPWLTPNFSDKTLHLNLSQEKEFKQWVSKTNPSTDLQWDQPRVLSKPQYMQHHSFLIETFLTNGKIIKKFMKHNSSQMPSHSWDSQKLNGTQWPNHLEEETQNTKDKEVTLRLQTKLSLKDSVHNPTKGRELSKSEEKMAGTLTSNLFLSIMSLSTVQWKSPLRESEVSQTGIWK